MHGPALRAVGGARKPKTDSQRHITYEPDRRPETANLLTIGTHFAGTTPETAASLPFDLTYSVTLRQTCKSPGVVTRTQKYHEARSSRSSPSTA